MRCLILYNIKEYNHVKENYPNGGGTAGHVTPNLALLPRLRAEGYEIHYIGTAEGIEKSLVDGLEGVTYHTISAGKLRRYFSLRTLPTHSRL